MWRPTWDLSRSFDWNYAHGPNLYNEPVEPLPQQHIPFLSWKLRSPLGIAAGPLPNARFVRAYARLGYSVLTYKTVRSCEHHAHAAPVLAQLEHRGYANPASSIPFVGHSNVSKVLPTELSSANSVGLPSEDPKRWREDVRHARASLNEGQILVVSVVGTPENEDTTEQLAEDFARCARWAVEAGADMIEVNLSCPNVYGKESEVYLDPEVAASVVNATHMAIKPVKLSAKLGYYADSTLMFAVLDGITPFLDALTMINAVKFPIITSDGEPYFPGTGRAYAGVGGTAIRMLAQDNVHRALKFLKWRDLSIPVIAVGGVTEPRHVDTYLALGAGIVEVATIAIWQPFFSYDYVRSRNTLEI